MFLVAVTTKEKKEAANPARVLLLSFTLGIIGCFPKALRPAGILGIPALACASSKQLLLS